MIQYNICKTCGACDGRAGLLINDECVNCHETRNTGSVSIHTNLVRTHEELNKTMSILDEPKKSIPA